MKGLEENEHFIKVSTQTLLLKTKLTKLVILQLFRKFSKHATNPFILHYPQKQRPSLPPVSSKKNQFADKESQCRRRKEETRREDFKPKRRRKPELMIAGDAIECCHRHLLTH